MRHAKGHIILVSIVYLVGVKDVSPGSTSISESVTNAAQIQRSLNLSTIEHQIFFNVVASFLALPQVDLGSDLSAIKAWVTYL